MAITRLSKRSQWESRWSNSKLSKIEFDPAHHSFSEIDNKLSKYIPANDSDKSFLEVGAFPGTYLWYFYKYFNYFPFGVEYVKSCAERSQNFLDDSDVPAKVIHADFFDLEKEKYTDGGAGWDVVASFGFVEHFDDTENVVNRHLQLAKSGGYVVISIPNHAGINGWIMKLFDKEKWKQHNCMGLEKLNEAIQNLEVKQILFMGCLGKIGFWNAGVYPVLRKKFGPFYPFIKAPFWILEILGRLIIPNNRLTSPDILAIIKKK